jgi:hypothetical protein
VESDKYCPYCAQDLRVAPDSGVAIEQAPR